MDSELAMDKSSFCMYFVQLRIAGGIGGQGSGGGGGGGELVVRETDAMVD
jgi:hypothetical protein